MSLGTTLTRERTSTYQSQLYTPIQITSTRSPTAAAPSGPPKTTEDHQFWNSANGEWVETQDLNPTDRLLGTNGTEHKPHGIATSLGYRNKAYDLTVDQTHNYFVINSAGQAALVHNCIRFNLSDDFAAELRSSSNFPNLRNDRVALPSEARWKQATDEMGAKASAIMANPDAGLELGNSEAAGGIYIIFDETTGSILRTGKSNDLVRNEADHKRDFS